MQQHCTVHSLEEGKKDWIQSYISLLEKGHILTVRSSESRDRERIIIRLFSFYSGPPLLTTDYCSW